MNQAYYYPQEPYSNTTAAMVWMRSPPVWSYNPGRAEERYQVPPRPQEVIEKKEVVQERIIERVIERPVYVDRIVEKEVPIERSQGMSMTSVTGILFIVLVCVITVKVIVPRLSWKYAIKAFVGLIYRPYRGQAKEIRAQWREANKGNV